MSRISHVPTYRKHKQSGQAIVTLRDAFGNRRDVLLGKHGTAASRQEYRRVLDRWEASGRQLSKADDDTLTINELVARYWPHVESYYRRPDGSLTHEVASFRYSLRPLAYLHGDTMAAEFSPADFKAVRQLMVTGYDHPKYGKQEPLCRNECNKRCKRIRRLYKWAVESSFVTVAVLQALQTVAPLKRGRTTARESPIVKPVARAVVEATLPVLRPMVADMVRLQLETGMRSGELVSMTAAALDMSGPVWLFKPFHSKMQHLGRERVIAIGPKGQTIIRRYLTLDTQAPLFSPRRVMEERAATMRANRKTPVQPSQLDRRKRKPKKQPGEWYTSLTYGRAISDAIKRFNRDKPDAEKLPRWFPHQLRHLRALEVKRQFGLDVARAVLGHVSPCLSEHYAGLDVAAAVDAMSKVG